MNALNFFLVWQKQEVVVNAFNSKPIAPLTTCLQASVGQLRLSGVTLLQIGEGLQIPVIFRNADRLTIHCIQFQSVCTDELNSSATFLFAMVGSTQLVLFWL